MRRAAALMAARYRRGVVVLTVGRCGRRRWYRTYARWAVGNGVIRAPAETSTPAAP